MIKPFEIDESLPGYMSYNRYVLIIHFKSMPHAYEFVKYLREKQPDSTTVKGLELMLEEYNGAKGKLPTKHRQFGNIINQLQVAQRMFFQDWKTWRAKVRVKGDE